MLYWERWLKKGDQYLAVSFNSDEKSSNEKCMLLNVQHPLVKQAAQLIDISKPRYVCLTLKKSDFESTTFDKDEYYFMAFQWKFTGVTTDTKIITIAESEELEKIIEENLACSDKLSNILNPNRDLWSSLNTIHQNRWEQEKENFIQKTKKIIDFKKRSLDTSFRAEKLSIESVLEETTDDKIKLMKESQLEHCIDNHNRKIKELDDKMNSVDIHFKTLIYGIIKIGE